MPWHSIHVHYHQSDLDGLLLGAVRPLFAASGPHVSTGYFIRHWRRGPHVRLNLLADRAQFDSVVHPLAERLLGEYLTRRPSRSTLDPDRLLVQHQRLAAAEREHGPLLPWLPDNSVRVAPYDSRAGVLGSEAAAALHADFLATSTPTAFEMIEAVAGGRSRPQIAFDLLIGQAHALGGGVTRGFVSYRSHAEAFLATEAAGQPDLHRTSWDRHYRTHAPALMQRVRQVVAAVDGSGPPVPFVADWIGLLARYRDRGRALIEAGSLPAPDGPAPEPDSPLWRSEFHRALARNDHFQRYVKHSVGFGLWRLLLNLTYLQLTRVGLSPYQRFLVCHLAADAVEQAYRVSALAGLAPARSVA